MADKKIVSISFLYLTRNIIQLFRHLHEILGYREQIWTLLGTGSLLGQEFFKPDSKKKGQFSPL